MLDTLKHKGMRRLLIKELARKGISDSNVLEAFYAVPRHFFLDLIFEQQAYSDQAFQIGSGQTISQPYTVAFQTQLLEIKKGDKILEIGTGSGFQTCILCQLGANVFSIERHRALFLGAKNKISALHFSPRLVYGDGYRGLPTWAPFDKILVTCGAPNIPETLVQQLKIGGMIVIPVGEGGKQTMLKGIRTAENKLETKQYGGFSFVPMLENKK